MRLNSVSLCLVVLCGCVPVFEQPPPPGAPDRDLPGIWISRDDQGELHLGVYAREDASLDLVLNHRDPASTNAVAAQRLTGYTTRINDQRLACLTSVETNDLGGAYLIFRYTVDQTNLSAWCLSSTQIQKLMDNGWLEGFSKETILSPLVVVTSTAARVRAALESLPQDGTTDQVEIIQFQRVP